MPGRLDTGWRRRSGKALLFRIVMNGPSYSLAGGFRLLEDAQK